MALDFETAQAEIDHCVRREREERDAAHTASDLSRRDAHVMEAERLADRAWSLTEEGDAPFIPSGLWRRARRADTSVTGIDIVATPPA